MLISTTKEIIKISNLLILHVLQRRRHLGIIPSRSLQPLFFSSLLGQLVAFLAKETFRSAFFFFQIPDGHCLPRPRHLQRHSEWLAGPVGQPSKQSARLSHPQSTGQPFQIGWKIYWRMDTHKDWQDGNACAVGGAGTWIVLSCVFKAHGVLYLNGVGTFPLL